MRYSFRSMKMSMTAEPMKLRDLRERLTDEENHGKKDRVKERQQKHTYLRYVDQRN